MAADSAHVDIAADRVAKVYAQAIVDAADAAGCRREVLAELAALARDVLPRVPDAAVVLSSPKVAPEEKSRIIDRLAKGRMQPTTTNTLHVLARHGRLALLGAVVRAAERLANDRDGRREATITTAVPLDAAEQGEPAVAGEHVQRVGRVCSGSPPASPNDPPCTSRCRRASRPSTR